jgi:hypothetical protein
LAVFRHGHTTGVSTGQARAQGRCEHRAGAGEAAVRGSRGGGAHQGIVAAGVPPWAVMEQSEPP